MAKRYFRAQVNVPDDRSHNEYVWLPSGQRIVAVLEFQRSSTFQYGNRAEVLIEEDVY
jgi:hypothetical protein